MSGVGGIVRLRYCQRRRPTSERSTTISLTRIQDVRESRHARINATILLVLTVLMHW